MRNWIKVKFCILNDINEGIYDNSKLNITAEFESIEKERLELVK